MGMVVRSNIMALNANRQLGLNNSQVSKSLEKLSSGYKINRAGDDASGLAISEKMKAQIKGLETASANSQDGISLVQTAEGALTEVHDMLNRMVELAGKAANGTIDNETDRAALQKEMNALLDEIDRIADSTDFNGIKLLNGDLAGMQITNPTAGLTLNHTNGAGPSTKDTYTIDMAGLNFDKDGTVTVGIGGKSYDVTVTAGMSHDDFVDALVTEINKDAPSDTAAGAYTASNDSNGTLKLESANAAAATDGVIGSITMTGKADDAGLTLQIGDTGDDFNKVTVTIQNMDSTSLGLDALRDTGIMTQDAASAALDLVKNGANSVINTVSSVRADLGAMQNRLEHTINNLDVATENMESANSRIRDTDMAKEMMEYTTQNVLTQAAQAMLAQANQQPQSILQLLQ